MAKAKKDEIKPEETEVAAEVAEQSEVAGEVEPVSEEPKEEIQAPLEEVKDGDYVAADDEIEPRIVAPCYFEAPEEYKNSFDREFVVDVLKSEYCKKQKACLTRESGATLMKNTFRPILSLEEGIGGIRRESVFSYLGSYYKVSAACKPDQDQRFVDWDNPLVSGDSNQVMAQKVDMVKVEETAFIPSAA